MMLYAAAVSIASVRNNGLSRSDPLATPSGNDRYLRGAAACDDVKRTLRITAVDVAVSRHSPTLPSCMALTALAARFAQALADALIPALKRLIVRY